MNEKKFSTDSSGKVLPFNSRPRPATAAELEALVERLEQLIPAREWSGSELIQVDERLAADLDYVERYSDNDWLSYKIRVRKIVPCPGCQRPIVRIKFSHDGQTRDCDAVHGYDNLWRADLLREHDCPIEVA